MTYNFVNITEALPKLCRRVMHGGQEIGSRNGRVKEIITPQILLGNPFQREVLCNERGANVFAQIAETIWVLSGRSDIEWLSAYLPRAVDYSDDGVTWRSGYGPRLRSYDGQFDQLAFVVDTLRADPLSRQAVISLWDPRVDGTYDNVKDRACNTQLQFLSRGGSLYLVVTVRSNDLMWGWSGINAFEWSSIQEIVAYLLGLRVGTLTFNIGSLHLYERHWEKALKIGTKNPQKPGDQLAPILGKTVRFDPHSGDRSLQHVDQLTSRWFELEAKCREGEVGVEDLYLGDPLFQAWGAAIAYFWTREQRWLNYLDGTTVGQAVQQTPSSVLPEPVERSADTTVAVTPVENVGEFYTYVADLHKTKHEAYGDSWKKRGEKLSILANIARKVDRIGVDDKFESQADTLIDLWVYLAKYLCWLNGEEADPEHVNAVLWDSLVNRLRHHKDPAARHPLSFIVKYLDKYMDQVDTFSLPEKRNTVAERTKQIATYAFEAWLAEDNYAGADTE